jgi:hypothetical protein
VQAVLVKVVGADLEQARSYDSLYLFYRQLRIRVLDRASQKEVVSVEYEIASLSIFEVV